MLYRCCTARVLLKFKGTVGLESSRLYSGRHAHIIRTHAYTQKQHRSQCHKNNFKYGCCCTMHDCHNLENLAFGVIRVHSGRQDRKPKGKSEIASLFFRLCFPCSYIRAAAAAIGSGLDALLLVAGCGSCTHTKHHSRHKGNSLNSGCCVLYSCCRTVVLLGTTAVAP